MRETVPTLLSSAKLTAAFRAPTHPFGAGTRPAQDLVICREAEASHLCGHPTLAVGSWAEPPSEVKGRVSA